MADILMLGPFQISYYTRWRTGERYRPSSKTCSSSWTLELGKKITGFGHFPSTAVHITFQVSRRGNGEWPYYFGWDREYFYVSPACLATRMQDTSELLIHLYILWEIRTLENWNSSGIRWEIHRSKAVTGQGQHEFQYATCLQAPPFMADHLKVPRVYANRHLASTSGSRLPFLKS